MTDAFGVLNPEELEVQIQGARDVREGNGHVEPVPEAIFHVEAEDVLVNRWVKVGIVDRVDGAVDSINGVGLDVIGLVAVAAPVTVDPAVAVVVDAITGAVIRTRMNGCLLYTSDAADE